MRLPARTVSRYVLICSFARSSAVVFIRPCTPNSGTSYCGGKVLARIDGGANVDASTLKLPQPLRSLALLRQTLRSLCLLPLIWFTLRGVGLPVYHYPRSQRESAPLRNTRCRFQGTSETLHICSLRGECTARMSGQFFPPRSGSFSYLCTPYPEKLLTSHCTVQKTRSAHGIG